MTFCSTDKYERRLAKSKISEALLMLYCSQLREDTHKKVFFLVVGPLRFYPPYTNGLVVHALMAWPLVEELFFAASL